MYKRDLYSTAGVHEAAGFSPRHLQESVLVTQRVIDLIVNTFEIFLNKFTSLKEKIAVLCF